MISFYLWNLLYGLVFKIKLNHEHEVIAFKLLKQSDDDCLIAFFEMFAALCAVPDSAPLNNNASHYFLYYIYTQIIGIPINTFLVKTWENLNKKP